MFRKTDPQRSLLECEFLLPLEKKARLEKSWAKPFRERILPLIDEEVFRDAFCEDNGRPNKSIRLLLCLHLLKEWNDLTDEEVLDQLEYNLQWHYALGIDADTAHTCQKTMHNFRDMLMGSDRGKKEFEHVTRSIAEADGVGLKRQRLDSTHILSNMAVLTRLGLFVETVTNFLKELRREDPDAFESLDAGYARRYLEREGYFSDAKREQARRRLPVVAEDVYGLVSTYETDTEVSKLKSFEVLVRLFEEQCEVVENDDKDGDEKGSGSSGGLRAQVIEPKTVSSDSLQSPYDPDATYGHKGKGYEAQISETCDDDNPYQLITGTAVNGAHESDQNALLPMLDQLDESEMLPDTMQADTNYGSGENIVDSAKRGVELQAPVQDPDAPPRPEHFAMPVWEQSQSESCDEEVEEEKSDQEASEAGIGLDEFTFNASFDTVVSCPSGHTPTQQDESGGMVFAVFSAAFCSLCPFASRCPTRELANGDRQFRRAPSTIATECRQAEQQTPAFKESYKKRAGIESTNQEMKGRHGMGALRILGKPRVVLSVHLKALALNVKRSVQHHVSKLTKPAVCACSC
jgi:hypothetical protein